MNIVFVTIGTSALENEELWDNNRELKSEVSSDRRAFIAGLEEEEPIPAGLENHFLQAHLSFWTKARNFRHDVRNRRLTSAEAISTDSAKRSKVLELRQGIDKVVLLLSNTELGKICGRLNEHIFRQFLFDPGPAFANDVLTETIQGLAPQALGAGGHQLSAIYPQVLAHVQTYLDGNDAQAFFNITGSYKGVIPPITHICATRYPNRSTVLYMHDQMPATITLKFPDDGRRVDEKPIYVDIG
jgi:hypothetical protein